jgi:hypothetical protein
MSLRRIGLLTVALAVAAAWAEAPHSHGVANLDVALDGRALTLELRAPAEDVLGFERKPATGKERAALEAAIAYLKGGRGFVPAAGANCRPADSAVALEEPSKGHFELVARLAYDCKEPEALREIDVALFSQYPKLKRIDARVATGKGQSAAKLTPAKRSLAF